MFRPIHTIDPLLSGTLEHKKHLIITLCFGLQVYEFTVIARDGGKVSLEGYAKVIVTLIDVNDNHPVFESVNIHHKRQR